MGFWKSEVGGGHMVGIGNRDASASPPAGAESSVLKSLQCIQDDVRRRPKQESSTKCQEELKPEKPRGGIDCCTKLSIEFDRHPGNQCEPSLGPELDVRLITSLSVQDQRTLSPMRKPLSPRVSGGSVRFALLHLRRNFGSVPVHACLRGLRGPPALARPCSAGHSLGTAFRHG